MRSTYVFEELLATVDEVPAISPTGVTVELELAAFCHAVPLGSASSATDLVIQPLALMTG